MLLSKKDLEMRHSLADFLATIKMKIFEEYLYAENEISSGQRKDSKTIIFIKDLILKKQWLGILRPSNVTIVRLTPRVFTEIGPLKSATKSILKIFQPIMTWMSVVRY